MSLSFCKDPFEYSLKKAPGQQRHWFMKPTRKERGYTEVNIYLKVVFFKNILKKIIADFLKKFRGFSVHALEQFLYNIQESTKSRNAAYFYKNFHRIRDANQTSVTKSIPESNLKASAHKLAAGVSHHIRKAGQKNILLIAVPLRP